MLFLLIIVQAGRVDGFGKFEIRLVEMAGIIARGAAVASQWKLTEPSETRVRKRLR